MVARPLNGLIRPDGEHVNFCVIMANMKNSTKLFLIVIATSFLCHSAYAKDDFFKPKLTENNDTLCKQLDDFIQTRHLGIEPAYFGKPEFLEKFNIPFRSKEFLYNQIKLIPKTHPGCGGACERYYFESWKEDKKIGELPPTPGGIKFFKTKEGRLVAVSELGQLYRDTSIKVFELMDDGQWPKLCQFEFPALSDLPGTVHEVLLDFKSKRHAIAGGAGQWCGSIKTALRWNSIFDTDLVNLAARPWRLANEDDKRHKKHIEGISEYDTDLANLDKWRLTGLENDTNFQAYQKSFDKTLSTLSAFYQSQYSWDKEKSEQTATKALRALAGGTIRFYMYDPFSIEGEYELRKAIIDADSIEEIQNLQFDYGQYQAFIKKKREKHKLFRRDTLLNVAINRPEVLEFLLQKGLDVNEQNEFGKTPLMYAVQFNQLEAVKILIDSGADINARTYIPWNKCFYNLNTFDYTPLVYAARYASAELLNYLLDVGASPELPTISGYKKEKKYPVEWLEENILISKAEKSALIKRMKIRIENE
tara:strand:- start:2706 stop:4307 length:1602 start_codon:yes stop_codon:yes gene_type:complete